MLLPPLRSLLPSLSTSLIYLWGPNISLSSHIPLYHQWFLVLTMISIWLINTCCPSGGESSTLALLFSTIFCGISHLEEFETHTAEVFLWTMSATWLCRSVIQFSPASHSATTSWIVPKTFLLRHFFSMQSIPCFLFSVSVVFCLRVSPSMRLCFRACSFFWCHLVYSGLLQARFMTITFMLIL